MKILDLDIETAPNIVYTWGLFNQNIGINQIVDSGYTLCWAASWHDKKTVEFRSIFHDGAEEMITRIHELLDEADIVVHYNGKNFDIPTLNKEFIKHGLLPPSPFQQIDLLETARKRFNFTSNKLDYVSQFLGLESKIQHKGMELWKQCMRLERNAWKEMRAYNVQDVKLLRTLYDKLLPWINNHPNLALYDDREIEMCTNCGSTHVVKNGMEPLQTQTYQRYRCADCGTNMKGRFTEVPLAKRKTVLTQSKL